MFMAIWITRLLALSAAASPRSTTVQEGLSDAVVGQVRSRLLETATKRCDRVYPVHFFH